MIFRRIVLMAIVSSMVSSCTVIGFGAGAIKAGGVHSHQQVDFTMMKKGKIYIFSLLNGESIRASFKAYADTCKDAAFVEESCSKGQIHECPSDTLMRSEIRLVQCLKIRKEPWIGALIGLMADVMAIRLNSSWKGFWKDFDPFPF